MSSAPIAITRGGDLSLLAWELALRGKLWTGQAGVYCAVELLGRPGREFVGCGRTSTEAARALALKLDHYVKAGARDFPVDDGFIDSSSAAENAA